jgi:hypothetical protein
MSILATCLTIAAIAAGNPAQVVKLKGSCGELVLRAQRPVTIEAEGSSVSGLRLQGNIRWRGGTITAPGGLDAKALPGYAVKIEGAGNSLYNARVTGANRGIVVDQAANTIIAGNEFYGLRVDGIIASRSQKLVIDRNKLFDFVPRPSRCVTAAATSHSVAKRDCAGTWTDGSHPDGIQLRNDVTDATISNNILLGDMQGIAQMDTKGDSPLERIVVRGNTIRVTDYHTVTLTQCSDCRIENNDVARGRLDRKAVIRAGLATRCGNKTADEKRDARCK